MSVRRPNLFIVGAPRCGTASLFRWLPQHPDVYMPHDVKEPNYLAPAFRSPRYPNFPQSEQEYLMLFEGARQERYVGEASVGYLYFQDAAATIRAFSPDARIVIMLRNPVDVVYSLHARLAYGGEEDITDFREALAAEEDRKKGMRLPRNIDRPKECFYYREIGRFGEQIERYLDVFTRERMHFILFKDLCGNPTATFRKCCEFLGIATDIDINLVPYNANRAWRSTVLTSVLKSRPMALVRCLVPARVRLAIKLALSTETPRQPMPADLRRELNSYFLPDVERVAKLIDADLSHWCRDRA